ncbi:hypothetical protein B484DRAFT_400278 [Ochromonadaceae sp. CCMP2298]|nr:hypothetical protein B484DRAFT_400278 [Ochromonadaceae sp. CCMP2298]
MAGPKRSSLLVKPELSRLRQQVPTASSCINTQPPLARQQVPEEKVCSTNTERPPLQQQVLAEIQRVKFEATPTPRQQTLVIEEGPVTLEEHLCRQQKAASAYSEPEVAASELGIWSKARDLNQGKDRRKNAPGQGKPHTTAPGAMATPSNVSTMGLSRKRKLHVSSVLTDPSEATDSSAQSHDPPPQHHRYPARGNATGWKERNWSHYARAQGINPVSLPQYFSAYRTTVTQALNGTHAEETREAIVDEIQNMLS